MSGEQTVALLDLPHAEHAEFQVRRELAGLPVQVRQLTTVPSGAGGGSALILGPESAITDAQIAALPDLRIVATTSTGYDHVPVDVLTRHGAWVTNVPDYCTDEVADHCLALALGLLRAVTAGDRQVRRGQWGRPSSDEALPPRRVTGSHLGLVGFGRIARALATRALALGVRVSTYSPSASSAELAQLQVGCFDTLDELLATVDIVSLHVPLTPQTYRLIDRDALARMRPDSYLINAARGDVVDQTALREALRSGTIAGAALDVLVDEPPSADDPLLQLDRLTLTPHIAWESVESLQALYTRAAVSVAAVLNGRIPRDAIGFPEAGAVVPSTGSTTIERLP